MNLLQHYRPSIRRILEPFTIPPRSKYDPSSDPAVQKTVEQGEKMDRLLQEVEVIKRYARRYK